MYTIIIYIKLALYIFHEIRIKNNILLIMNINGYI